MQDFFTMLFVLIVMLASCNAYDGGASNNDIEEFEQKTISVEEKEIAIAEMVNKHEDLVDVAVSISGDIAVIGLDLANNSGLCHTDIIAIKQRTVDEVKAHFEDINHVAVTTAPDMFKKLANPFENVECPHEATSDLFDIPIPMP